MATLRKHYIEKGLKKQRRHELLKMMEEESQRWLYLENVDEGIKNSVLIPNNMQYQTDYYIRLQEKAILVALGKYDEIEESKTDNRVLQYKNSKLIPLYANITGLLTRLRDSDLERLYEEFEIASYGLKELGLNQQALESKQQELSSFYEMLIMKLKRDMNQPKVKIKLLEEKLILIYNVLILWREYTSFLNMPFEDVESVMSNELQQ